MHQDSSILILKSHCSPLNQNYYSNCEVPRDSHRYQSPSTLHPQPSYLPIQPWAFIWLAHGKVNGGNTPHPVTVLSVPLVDTHVPVFVLNTVIYTDAGTQALCSAGNQGSCGCCCLCRLNRRSLKATTYFRDACPLKVGSVWFSTSNVHWISL